MAKRGAAGRKAGRREAQDKNPTTLLGIGKLQVKLLLGMTPCLLIMVRVRAHVTNQLVTAFLRNFGRSSILSAGSVISEILRAGVLISWQH